MFTSTAHTTKSPDFLQNNPNHTAHRPNNHYQLMNYEIMMRKTTSIH